MKITAVSVPRAFVPYALVIETAEDDKQLRAALSWVRTMETPHICEQILRLINTGKQ